MKADHASVTQLLKTARGQLDGILRMVEEDRYCIDISHQVLAVEALLRKANREILRAHLACCVRDAMRTDVGDEKIDEIIAIVDKLPL